ncbi:MAG: 30S ribosomal protein S17 [Methylococcaceae bacterium]
MNTEVKSPRTQTGKVVGTKMHKSIRVQVDRLVPHPVYGKYVRKSSTLLAHDENNETKEGDIVIVKACKPLSKRKVWTLDKVLVRAAF